VSDVEALDQIDRVDRERARLHLDAERLDAALAEAVTGATSRRAAEDAARAVTAGHRTEERAAERRIEELRDKKASATRVLETGAGDAAAAQRQVERCDALIDDAETQLLGLLDVIEAARKQLAAATAERARADHVLETARAEMPPRIADLRAREATAAAEVATRLSALPAELRARYSGLRDKGRWPVARVKGGKCDACSMTAQPQTMVDLKRGRLLECHGCRRWLLLPAE
jgi:predicted  nucleic acid-binding Zn-ribbon protein